MCGLARKAMFLVEGLINAKSSRASGLEFVAHTEHKKTGRKCGSDLEIIQKCG